MPSRAAATAAFQRGCLIPKWVNFILFQVGWLACVLGAARGWFFAGPLCVAVIVIVHLWRSRRVAAELKLLGTAAVLGTALDSLGAVLGVLRFAGPPLLGWLCPLWITMLWANFATTLNSSLAWLPGRTAWSAVFGAVGGPLAYYAGARLQALTLPAGPALGLLFVALEWTLAMSILAWVTRRNRALADMPPATSPVTMEQVP